LITLSLRVAAAVVEQIKLVERGLVVLKPLQHWLLRRERLIRLLWAQVETAGQMV